MTTSTSDTTGNVGRDVLAAIRAYGVDTVFGIPGTHNLEFYRHLGELGFHAVTTRHEQGAGFAADGWAQQTRLPGVVITTSGPGLLNVLSSAATAYAESRPLLVVSPGAPLGREAGGVGALHETKNQVGASDAVLGWSRRVTSGTQAVQAVHDAFALFMSGRPRPVHIEVPLDVLEGESDCPAELLAARPAKDPPPVDRARVREAAGALAAASRPVVIAGGGAVPACPHVAALAEALDAPVMTSVNGKGVLAESHPLALGSELRLSAARALVNQADAVLVVGSKLGEAETWFEALEPVGTVIRVDIDPDQLEANLPSDITVLGDSRALVPALIDALSGLDHCPTRERGAERVRLARPVFGQESSELAPAMNAVARAVVDGMPGESVMSGDSSQVTYLAASSVFGAERPGAFLYMPTWATLGYGLPAAIGAKIARPDVPVVCLLGDGALMFSLQELMTVVEQRLDLLVVCVDNGGYGEIRQNELDRGMPPIGVELAQPDWPALATAFGGVGRTLHRAEDLTETVRDTLAAGGLQLIHVPSALFDAEVEVTR